MELFDNSGQSNRERRPVKYPREWDHETIWCEIGEDYKDSSKIEETYVIHKIS